MKTDNGRWPLKPEARIIGIDDGLYVRGSRNTPIVMTVMRGDGYIEGFLTASVATDGTDSAEKICGSIENSRFKDQARAIMSDGACLAGFNVLDLEYLHDKLQIPVLTCSDKEPDDNSIFKALEKHFSDWGARYELISRWKPEEVGLKDGICHVRYCGTTSERAKWLVRKMTIRGRTPEPIRISHMISSEVFRIHGELNG